MNTLERKPVIEKKQSKVAVESSSSQSSDRQILDALYNHYGRPENIVKEKVKLYKHYVSPAGHASPDWVVDGWQQGRATIFTGHKENEDDLFYKTKIDHSWFIAIKDNKLKVSIDGKVDIILEMGE